MIRRAIVVTTITATVTINEDAQGNQEIEEIEEIRDIFEFQVLVEL